MTVVFCVSKDFTPVPTIYRGNPVLFFGIKTKPKKLNCEDTVLFAKKQYIRYRSVFKGYLSDPMCERTGKIYAGINLLLTVPEVTNGEFVGNLKNYKYIKE